MITFIGIDLAWKSARNPSGAAVLRGDEEHAELVDIAEPIFGLEDVLAYIRKFTTERTIIAVDAPLVIPNSTGQRICETLVGKRYGAHHASCHTSNQKLYPEAASVVLALSLVHDGFCHAPDSGGARLMLEVYPHAALVRLFALEKIIKYKKGTASARRLGLRVLQTKVAELIEAEPPLVPTATLEQFLSANLESFSGKRLKNYEDAIDGLICAYLAYHYWRWRSDRTEVFGSVEAGYIVNPCASWR